MSEVPTHLVSGVELLSLDAGNTVIFLDHQRLARSSRTARFSPSVADIDRGERLQKRRAETGDLVDPAWLHAEEPGARQWGRTVAPILDGAGLPAADAGDLLVTLWREHTEENFWCRVPDDLPEALRRVRDAGIKVAIVSNSEGRLDALFRRIGLRDLFDDLEDSGVVGVEKPDAKIFEYAMEACGVTKAATLHLGAIFATDILGARNAEIRHALIDPLGQYEGAHPDVVRVPGVAAVADAVLTLRR